MHSAFGVTKICTRNHRIIFLSIEKSSTAPPPSRNSQKYHPTFEGGFLDDKELFIMWISCVLTNNILQSSRCQLGKTLDTFLWRFETRKSHSRVPLGTRVFGTAKTVDFVNWVPAKFWEARRGFGKWQMNKSVPLWTRILVPLSRPKTSTKPWQNTGESDEVWQAAD